VSLLFHLGELSATPEALAAARAAGVQVVEAVLRHLGGDWGDVDDQTRAANHDAVTAGGTLRSVYRLTGASDAVVVTTDADRAHTIVALASRASQAGEAAASSATRPDPRPASHRPPPNPGSSEVLSVLPGDP
jgi:hypothetical protein